MSNWVAPHLADHDALGEGNPEDRCETNIETNMTLEEEALVVLWRWNVSRRKKNTDVENSAMVIVRAEVRGYALAEEMHV